MRYCIASLTWFGSILSIPSRSASVRLTFKILSYARADLVTVDSEQRLGQTLLQIARKLGKKDPRSIRIELRISHEELASMVGTTRPRISVFMQRFRNLGLIERSDEHHLIVKEHKLTAYLASIA